ncbi:hypothetical protein IQ273_03575 [Nodosilinea sp. LEGE 07298]|uniref:hypothetical protein n=1 Tax=Nodosilinea sp. LEGE 07298 TaxID=2777970 RepID=UPI0018822353|nr:hypothetical protein [Nodosilinea sp. LEGE 07298]MBE9108500.1 hypothetical protein [Nodosilinea sp. LEGE 07298]
MVSSVVRSLTPWLPSEPTALPGATAPLLSNTVCRMAPLAIERPTLERVPEVAAALEQLVRQSMTLRSPIGGWPTDLPQTPENLALYLSEETWELLDALETAAASPSVRAPGLLPVTVLVPQLLWMLASGGYEIMRLIEGVQARVSGLAASGSGHIVRLVPVLVLTLEETSYALDLVTQTDPTPALYLSETAEISLLDNDLDSQPWLCKDLLGQVAELLGYAQPGLVSLLGKGDPVEALRPFQPWQPARLHLHLHLAQMETRIPSQPSGSEASPGQNALYLLPGEPQNTGTAASGFTLDDFASTLIEDPSDATAGVLGDWLTFTDESWIQTFLSTCTQRIIAQNLPQMALGEVGENAAAEQLRQREAFCNLVTHTATDLVQGTNGLFKHTFVHEPVLVADVWPRLRWYLAQSSEQVMQLMGGVSAQVLPPGLSWQQGSLYLRPLMQLTTSSRSWIIDLSRGRLLPTSPLALPADAAVDIADAPWRTPLTVADLTARIDRDLGTYTPAIATLRHGTPIHLHRLDAEAGCQPGQLTLDWCFTLQTTL